MKPHPRIRKTIKWGGAVVTVVLVVLWISSAWVFIRYLAPEVYGRLTLGELAITYGTEETRHYPTNPWGMAWHSWVPWTWSFELHGELAQWELVLPLWIPILPIASLTAAAWWLDILARRHAKLKLCPKCGYDRTGLASKDAKCPECGAVPASV